MNTNSRLQETLPQLLLFATFATLLSLAELSSRRFERLMQEDGFAEWATFSSFFLAFVLAARELARSAGASCTQDTPRWLTRLTWIGLSAFCLFVAGEEISWGQRLLGFRPPALFLENNFQQESNLHNLLKGILDTRWMVFLVCAVYGVVAPYAAHVTRWPRVLAAPLPLLPWFAAVAWLEFAYPYELVGELAELMLGLLFVLDVIERQHGQEAWPVLRSASTRGALAVALSLALALVLLPLNDLSLRQNRAELVAFTRSELATLAGRMQSGDTLQSSLFRKQEVHKRLYTAVKAGYVDLARERFYLDAWNSPYWVSFARDPSATSGHAGRVLLYSFGPNRKRELDPARARAGVIEVAGDDVAVAFDVALPTRAAR